MASKPVKTVVARRGSASSPTTTSKLSKLTMEDTQESSKQQMSEQIKEQTKIMTEMFQKMMDQNIEKIQGMLAENNLVISKKIKEDLAIDLREMQQEFLDEMASNSEKIKEEIQSVTTRVDDLSGKVEDLEKSKQKTETEFEDVKTKSDRNEMQILTLQYRNMELALRVRGLPERKLEDLKYIFAEALAELLQRDVKEMEFQIDRIYRVNSWFARQNQLPRDIVIYFVRRSLRNEILAQTFKKKLVVENHQVSVLKEIPPKMLRGRRDFAFLTKELQLRNLDYKWEIPYGLTVYFQGKRFRILTESKGKDFLYNVLKVEIPETLVKEVPEEGAIGGAPRSPSPQHPLDQRMTRAALKKMEQQEKEKDGEVIDILDKQDNGAVGGARPKKRRDDAQELRKAGNGK